MNLIQRESDNSHFLGAVFLKLLICDTLSSLVRSSALTAINPSTDIEEIFTLETLDQTFMLIS